MQQSPCHDPSRIVCVLCGRRGGEPADGASINILGCTGACIDWALRVIKNPPFFELPREWQLNWAGRKETVAPTHVEDFRAICSNMNALGYAYLHWNRRSSDVGPGDMLAVEWIALARERYASCLSGVHGDLVTRTMPHVPSFYQILDIVLESCMQVPTALYTVHCEVTEDDVCRVQTTTMSGQLLKDVLVPRGVPFNAWQHVPEPPYRIADDMNLYTRQEFEHYHGHKAPGLWIRAPPCYEHIMEVITGKGDLAQLWDVDTRLRALRGTKGM